MLSTKKFYTFINLQGSQTRDSSKYAKTSFTPLQTYKVLKPQIHFEAIAEHIHFGKCCKSVSV